METINLLNVKNRYEFREWLTDNHSKENECWVIVKRGRPTDSTTFWYLDAVEEALCFGWIDSTQKKISDTSTAQRFAKRRKNSNRTELNKERCRRLEKLGLMTDSGRAALPDISESGFVINQDILTLLQSDNIVWQNFLSFPPLYQRVRIDTIQFNKHRPELYQSRLAKFVENTRKGIMYGEWNDNGRLLDY